MILFNITYILYAAFLFKINLICSYAGSPWKLSWGLMLNTPNTTDLSINNTYIILYIYTYIHIYIWVMCSKLNDKYTHYVYRSLRLEICLKTNSTVIGYFFNLKLYTLGFVYFCLIVIIISIFFDIILHWIVNTSTHKIWYTIISHYIILTSLALLITTVYTIHKRIFEIIIRL